jgi:hypothetical protein
VKVKGPRARAISLKTGYADKFHQYDAVDYLMDFIRHSRAKLLEELGASHPTRRNRGAKPRPIPVQFQRNYPADLKLIRERITQHFDLSGVGRM